MKHGGESFQHLKEYAFPWPGEERGRMIPKKTFAVLGYSKQSLVVK